MKTDNAVEMVLSCASWHEAQRVADHLFAQKLIETAELIDAGFESVHFDAAAKGVKLLIGGAEHSVGRISREVTGLLGRPIELLCGLIQYT